MGPRFCGIVACETSLVRGGVIIRHGFLGVRRTSIFRAACPSRGTFSLMDNVAPNIS